MTSHGIFSQSDRYPGNFPGIKASESMFLFKAEQKKYEIGGVKIGGQPGEVPTVLVGSIFYSRHKIVSDERAGIFDKDAADALIKQQAELSDRTGNPALLDIVGSTPEAIKKYIDFVAGASEKPFLIDSPGVDVKIAAVEYAKEAGLEDRIIYNSVSIETKDAEFDALKKNRTSAAILLAYTKKITSSAERVAVVERFAPRLAELGVSKVLIDTFVMDVPSLTPSCKAAVEIKSRAGFPCGCAAHNAISTWSGVKNLLGRDAVRSADVVANLMPVILGCDFLLYGPVEDSAYVFPAVFTIDTSYRYAYRTKELISI